jgi:N-acetylglucosaminyl-diphospho-decaprenol L-rhamnosyltransferase
MRLLIVIVNYRSAPLAIDCLRSLKAEVSAIPGVHVVVTDGASPDDSVPQLRQAIADNAWGTWVTLQPLPNNGGFAYGNNEAVRPALAGGDPPDYVLLLNPDTVARPGAIGELLQFMDANPGVGIAGSRLEDPDGTPQRSAFRFHSAPAEFENTFRLGLVSKLMRSRVVAPDVPQEACQTDWVSGASMIVRRKVFEDIGLLDERYFMYFEETDFCLRARRAGWTCWYVPASRVVHLVGQCSGVTDKRQPPRRRPVYWFDSRRRYFVKNHGRAYALLADMAWAAGMSVYRVRRLVQRKPDTDPPKFLADFLRRSTLAQGFKI